MLLTLWEADYAATIVAAECAASAYVLVCKESTKEGDLERTFTVLNKTNQHESAVTLTFHDDDVDRAIGQCCAFGRFMGLPCRHVMAVRHMLGKHRYSLTSRTLHFAHTSHVIFTADLRQRCALAAGRALCLHSMGSRQIQG